MDITSGSSLYHFVYLGRMSHTVGASWEDSPLPYTLFHRKGKDPSLELNGNYLLFWRQHFPGNACIIFRKETKPSIPPETMASVLMTDDSPGRVGKGLVIMIGSPSCFLSPAPTHP